LIEFALVLPVFMVLVLGSFTGAIAYNDKASVTQGAREGARYGATLAIHQCDDVANCGGLDWAQLVQSTAVNHSAGSATTSSVCVALVSGSGATQAAIDSNHTTAGGTSPCWIDSSIDTSLRVQVSISRVDTINFLVDSMAVTLLSQATSKYEQ
jgi:Flp pilus assembly protein TadG